MRKLIFAVIFSSLALALVAAGCGGSGASGSAATLTKAEFIRKADAQCDKGNQEQSAAVRAYESPTANEEELVTKVMLPHIQANAERLGEMEAPSGDKGKVNAVVKGVERAVGKAREDPASLLKGTSDPFAKASKLAAEYGFKVCGQY